MRSRKQLPAPFNKGTGLFLLLCSSFSAQAELRVFACEPEWAALTAELAPEAKIYTATTVYQDPHFIEARPSLIAKLRNADLLVCSGAGLEAGWLPLLIRQANNPAVLPDTPGHFLAAMQVDRLDVPEKLDRSMGDVHAEGNPHVHLDPHRVKQIAAALLPRLEQIDPQQAVTYRRNHANFEQRWQAAIQRWETAAKPLFATNIVVHHKEWRYLETWLGMQIVASLEPKPGIPPNIGYLNTIKSQLANRTPLAILRKPADSSKPSKWLGNATGAPALVLPYTVGGEGAEDLFSLFDQTLDQLLSAKTSATPQ